MTGLPPSARNMVILTIADHFSKVAPYSSGNSPTLHEPHLLPPWDPLDIVFDRGFNPLHSTSSAQVLLPMDASQPRNRTSSWQTDIGPLHLPLSPGRGYSSLSPCFCLSEVTSQYAHACCPPAQTLPLQSTVTGPSSECVVSQRQHRLRVGPVGDCLGEEFLDAWIPWIP